MAINTFVWGFVDAHSEIINTMTLHGVITPKCWLTYVSDKSMDGHPIYKITSFFYTTWIQKYRGALEEYAKSSRCDHDTYRAIFEKTIYPFIDYYSRHDTKFQNRGIHFYTNQFNLLFRFFDGVFTKEKIELALFSNIPHEGVELVAYQIAKARNIKTMILTQSRVPNKMFYMENVEDYGDFRLMTPQTDLHLRIERKHSMNHFDMRNIRPYHFSVFKMALYTIKKPHRCMSAFANNYQKFLRARKFRKHLAVLARPVDYDKKYVYFPLHLQPELTTSALGGIFNDQVLALEVLSKMIPKDWVIYVKENPKQTEFMRDDTFFERLKLIENLRMAPLTENTFKLTEHSQFVATITGTVGWEAICGGKPALVFGQAWYQNFEGAFKWHKDINVHDVVNYQIDHEKLEKDYNALVSKCAEGVIDRDYKCIVENYDEAKNTRRISEFLTKWIRDGLNSHEEELRERSILYDDFVSRQQRAGGDAAVDCA